MSNAINTPDEYLTLPYGRLLVRDAEGGFSAEILEFPGCVAEGETADEAVDNVERAARAWVASELEAQHSIPEPVSGADYSGRIALRLPRSLHRALALKAQRDRTSINQEIAGATLMLTLYQAWVLAQFPRCRCCGLILDHEMFTLFTLPCRVCMWCKA